ncbi:fimbrial protein [Candidatus Magnetobacterium bavaricum]|uniref:Fimbrial protein n=1 Tax=Candidatus Magnetobacterium bavaricum TaxID=29290 RepID=A0A0F3GZK7_9BACT|nr:fimbrial protein [Candidatus Magnetobacterium bavaricum]
MTFYVALSSDRTVEFAAFLFQIPYFIATGWIYYILHIAEKVRFNATEIVSGVFILALLLVGLHTFLRWFSAEFRHLRNEPPTGWPLRWTIVSVAVFVLIFVTGIATTASIHQLIWIAKAPKRLESVKGCWIRAVESGAKAAVSDLQGYLDLYAAGEPYIIAADSTTGKQGCIEAANAATTGKTCQAIHNQAVSATYTPFPDGMDEVLSDFINHQTNMGKKSPYTGLPLFVATHTTEGEVVLTPISNRAVSITAYAEDIAEPIFSTVVTVSSK